MAVSVVEVAQGTNGLTTTTPTVTLAGTPVAGDIVYVTIGVSVGNRTVSGITGLGATWSEVVNVNTLTATSHIVWRGVGATTAGLVTVTLSATSNGSVRAFLVRGLPASPPHTVATAIAGGTPALPGPVQSAGLGCLVLALGHASVKTTGNLLEGTQPATGWAIQAGPAGASGYHHTGYLIPTATGPAQCTLATGTTATRQITQIVFGVAAASGFTGWGTPA